MSGSGISDWISRYARPLLASVALHAVVVAALVLVLSRVSVRAPSAAEPIFIDLTAEEQLPALAAATFTAADERRFETDSVAPVAIRENPPLPARDDRPAERKPVACVVDSSAEGRLLPEEPVPEPSPEPSSEHASVAAPEERARVVAEPRARNRIVPVYPRSARRNGQEGEVVVEAEIADDGAVVNSCVVVSSGVLALDSAALKAVKLARFEPATEDGIAVSARIRLPFLFRLGDGR